MATKTGLSDQEYLQRYAERLPNSVSQAKWISSPDEHADHDGQTLATRSHEVIEQWAADRDAAPVTVTTEHEGRPDVLRFDFPGSPGGRQLDDPNWDRWFDAFDARELVMVFQENLSNGSRSNFFIFNNPHRSEG
ncbi:MAG TPA: hypothetical protein VLA05_09580 [Coriobacteriia bacterium]|nr:hypothetical protein [Coriobacteriia bacterium]